MSHTEFQKRLNRLNSIQPAEEQASHRQPNASQPQRGPARTRAERLDRALAILARHGVTGAYAYAPAFHGLAKLGMAPKPLFYRSAVGLFLFAIFLFAALIALETFVSVSLDMRPRFLSKLAQVGPLYFFGVIIAVSVGFAAFHRVKAAQMNLPKWKDL